MFRTREKLTAVLDVAPDEDSPASAPAAGSAALVQAWLAVPAFVPEPAVPAVQASPEELAVRAVPASPAVERTVPEGPGVAAVLAALVVPGALAVPAVQAGLAALVGVSASPAAVGGFAVPAVLAAPALSPDSVAMGRGLPVAASGAAVRPEP